MDVWSVSVVDTQNVDKIKKNNIWKEGDLTLWKWNLLNLLVILKKWLIEELDDYSSNKKKIAAKRARKKTLELTELFKTFRKQSVADCKTF